jgi:hypothetical protein
MSSRTTTDCHHGIGAPLRNLGAYRYKCVAWRWYYGRRLEFTPFV